ncbi:hypothetical protein V1283_002234 [Bradyrhizobium sp. AZCC 2262]|uniref:hypothetical protein n=1 Tax=Bradyrhizobium sp. AZCC 2262 TaxID=3117022 RepID=UPI002FF31768
MIAREGTNSPYCRPFDIGGICISNVRGGGGAARRSVAIEQKTVRPLKAGQRKQESELIGVAMPCMRRQAAARTNWLLRRLTRQMQNERKNPKSLAYQSSELAAVLHLVRHGFWRQLLSADRALLFAMPRSNPSWVQCKIDAITY